MERIDYYFKHIKNQKSRIGTRVPLINRKPNILNINNNPIPKNARNTNHNPNHNIIQGLHYKELKERNFVHNEQIKSMLRTVNKFPHELDKSINQNNSLPKIDKMTIQSQNKKSRSESVSSTNNLHKTTTSSHSILQSYDNNTTNKNNIEQHNQKLHLTPIKRLQRNQSQVLNTSLMMSKSENKRKLKLLSGITIKNIFSRTRTGETAETIRKMLQISSQSNNIGENKNKKKQKNNLSSPNILAKSKTLKDMYQKKNEDALIIKWDFVSKTFGKISLFGILNGIGKYGYYAAKYIRNFIIDYFEKHNIETSINKDNYYTILSDVFKNANEYLKNSKYDCDFSGTTCLLLFFPGNYNHTIYCANSGHSKAVAYSHTMAYPLSYEHYPSLISEQDRVLKTGNIVNGDTISLSQNTLNQIYQNFNMKNIDSTKYREEYSNGIKIARVIGCFCWEQAGVIADPQIVECNLKKEDSKVIVIGSDGLWKYLTIDKVGEIVMRYYNENNIFGACKELEETARLKWRKLSKEVDDISLIVIFLQYEKLKL